MKNHDSEFDKPNLLYIRYDRLENIIKNNLQKMSSKNDWLAPLGVVLSLLMTILVSDFKDVLFLNKEQWRTLVFISLFTSVVWFFISLVNFFKSSDVDDLLREVVLNSKITNEYRAIFLIKSMSSDHSYRVLVYRDILAGCYYLPHAKIKKGMLPIVQNDVLGQYISSILAVPIESISLHYISEGDLSSYKFSDFHKQDTSYYFKFFLLVVNEPDVENNISKMKLIRSGQSYLWLTLDEMENDQNTIKKNMDITRHLRDNYGMFFSSIPDSLPHKLEMIKEQRIL